MSKLRALKRLHKLRNTRLQKEVKDLMRGYREQDKGYNDFDMEEEAEVE